MKSCFNDIYRGKRVLITGHTGFKGSWLAIWLQILGAEVAGVALEPVHDKCNFNVTKLGSRIDNHFLDITDYQSLQRAIADFKPDIIFHLAAQALVGTSYDEPKRTFDTNIGGTLNVLESIRNSREVKAGVLITSDKCYRNVEQIWGYREEDRLGGDDPYSASKAGAELIIRSYTKSFFSQESSPLIASTRAGNVIGGGDWSENRLVPDCIRHLNNNEPIIIRNPSSTRPWQLVLEPLSGYLLLGQKLLEKSGGFTEGWNFGPSMEECHTVLEVAELIVKLWGAGETKVTGNQQAFYESTLLQLDCTKARVKLGWHQTLNTKESLEFTVNWYKHLKNHPDADMFDFCAEQLENYQLLAHQRRSGWTQ
ncbi:CDP-glucose 4,6-dehydratase [bacterium]|nr:CDP-glucose 4,6-dehydratase [bacterium]